MEYPLEYVQERAAMEDKERTMWAEKVSKYARLLSRLLPYCTSPAGENYPEEWRWCMYCQIVEGTTKFSHQPDCPVIEARQMLARDYTK